MAFGMGVLAEGGISVRLSVRTCHFPVFPG